MKLAHKTSSRGFTFGERVDGYDIPVLNERAVRAAAGVLLVGAMIAFMNAWLLGNFQPTRVFVVAFLLDFSVRLFAHPRYAPSLILGQWLVRRQQPEWVGAPQKRFAWAIGFVLAASMFYLVVLRQVIGPINILVCLSCLTLLFFESTCGICIGCHLYRWIRREPPQLCPGGACARTPESSPRTGGLQLASLALFAVAVAAVTLQVYRDPTPSAAAAATQPLTPPAAAARADSAIAQAEAERCKVPDFAKAIGHEALWKLHNKC
ncbi:DUF4395 domain-containing protein [Tibeticola sp.]|uniref:DUF4395 domain-containing protein n=1 Tax=Tibeticola sp. TaxID=2005368 RepID=UPI0025D75B82|nr:DUF4395 domain-containing protein [Tibeticola sp.]